MTLSELNQLPEVEAKAAFNKCCGSTKWIESMVGARPYGSIHELFEKARLFWANRSYDDAMEAFALHPKIGDLNSLAKKFAHTKGWAGNEQKGMDSADMATIEKLAAGNKEYEEKFGYIFIVCATGKSAAQMLDLLTERLTNNQQTEYQIACEEQHKITEIRLKKLLA